MKYFWKQCHFGHKWGKYGEQKDVTLDRYVAGTFLESKVRVVQERRCDRCGKEEFIKL